MACESGEDNQRDETKTVTLRIFSSHETGKLVAANLEAHGIACWVNADDCGGNVSKSDDAGRCAVARSH